MSTLRGDKEALEAENRSVTNALRAKGEQLDNALRQLEHVEAALDTAAQDGRRLHNKLAAAEGLLQARAEMLDGMKADKTRLETELGSTRARAEAAEAGMQALQADLHSGMYVSRRSRALFL